MHERAIAGAFAGVVLFGAAPAWATAPGDSGDAVLSADRLFGLTFTHMETENPGPGRDPELDATELGLGFSPPDYTPYEVPRFGFDYFVIDSLSVGGALGIASWSSEDEDGDDGDLTSFLIYPRVGWMFRLGNAVGFWIRGGFTYHSTSRDQGGDENGLAFSAEGLFVLAPVDHFGFSVGPVFDWTLTGEVDDPDRDRRYRLIGITCGVLGWL